MMPLFTLICASYMKNILNQTRLTLLLRTGNDLKKPCNNQLTKPFHQKLVSSRDKLPQLIPNLRRLIRQKNRLHAKLKKTGGARLRTRWRKVRRKVSSTLNTKRNQYIINIIGDIHSDPKPFWKVVTSQRKDNQTMPSLKTSTGDLAERDLENAEIS